MVVTTKLLHCSSWKNLDSISQQVDFEIELIVARSQLASRAMQQVETYRQSIQLACCSTKLAMVTA